MNRADGQLYRKSWQDYIQPDTVHDGQWEALLRHGTLDRRADHVQDPSLRGDEFLDPRDTRHVKYEMIRPPRKEGETVTSAAGTIGFSRLSLYQAQWTFGQQA